MADKKNELSEENKNWIATFPHDRIRVGRGEYGVTIHSPTSRPVVIVTELASNSGQSVTNCIEDLAKEILVRYRIAQPDRVIWVEHYERRLSLDIVELTWDDCVKKFSCPDWRPLGDAEITTLRKGVAWIGGPDVPDWF